MTGCDQSDQLGLFNVMIDVLMLGLVERPGRRTGEIMTGGILDVVVLAWLVAVIGTPASQAQTRVPKREAACPMGYVDTAQGTCSTLGLMTYPETIQRRRLPRWMGECGRRLLPRAMNAWAYASTGPV